MLAHLHDPAADALDSINCEFCDEVRDPGRSRFGSIYGPGLARTVIRQAGFLVQPTLGQLFEGSMLILPEAHVETMAQLSSAETRSCLTIVEMVEKHLTAYGHPILFEHGARSAGGGGCGIYHAHFHLVPVPSLCPAMIEDLMPRIGRPQVVSSLEEALNELRGVEEYLLLRDTSRQIGICEIPASMRGEVPSQFFRRALVAHYGLATPWDWRQYQVEPRLISTLRHFSSHAA